MRKHPALKAGAFFYDFALRSWKGWGLECPANGLAGRSGGGLASERPAPELAGHSGRGLTSERPAPELSGHSARQTSLECPSRVFGTLSNTFSRRTVHFLSYDTFTRKIKQRAVQKIRNGTLKRPDLAANVPQSKLNYFPDRLHDCHKRCIIPELMKDLSFRRNDDRRRRACTSEFIIDRRTVILKRRLTKKFFFVLHGF
ncbi:hypothetical protein SAMN04490247_2565 [Salimicrobium halophilum]|uniref:Uncharacterized protein n=1 Tax=Salimicrobium halophilum TaxID=86666 RepID=A0A1G8V869_9BACI|nr:hypothetical protein SAMN04490247_2565 [Salimicrobium halophilum]